MRSFLARLILVFARLVTLPLGRERRADATARVLTALKQGDFRLDTKRGTLLLHADVRANVRTEHRVFRQEPDTLEWLDAMPDDACLWDIGANIGAFSLYAALGTARRVVAFEPAAVTFGEFSRNIELNGMSDRVAAYCIALSEETRLDMLNMPSTTPGECGHGFGVETNLFDDVIDVIFRQPAIGFAIDDFVRIFAPPSPSHVKIDVDSIEAAILRGGRETLSAPSVVSVIVEVVGDDDSARNREIYSLMAELGFTPRPKASPEYRNVIFDRKT